MEESPIAAQPPYHGPAELREDWQAFAAACLFRQPQRGPRQLALLDALAFELPERAARVAQAQRPAETARLIGAFLRDHAGRYEALRTDLREVVQANADGDVGNPLNKAIIDRLARLWLALEQAHALPVLPTKQSLKKGQEWAAHLALLRSPEGGLVSATLLAATDGALRAQTQAVLSRCGRRRFVFEEVYSLAYDIFTSSLFRYEEGKGANFLTYVTIRLKHLLQRDALAGQDGAVSLDAPPPAGKAGGEGGDWYDSIPDPKARTPQEEAMAAEDAKRLPSLLEKLPPNYAKIIRLRYGMEGEPPLSQKEIAERSGCTRAYVQQLEKKARDKLRFYAALHEAQEGRADKAAASAQECSPRASARSRRRIDPHAPHIHSRSGRARGDDA